MLFPGRPKPFPEVARLLPSAVFISLQVTYYCRSRRRMSKIRLFTTATVKSQQLEHPLPISGSLTSGTLWLIKLVPKSHNVNPINTYNLIHLMGYGYTDVFQRLATKCRYSKQGCTQGRILPGWRGAGSAVDKTKEHAGTTPLNLGLKLRGSRPLGPPRPAPDLCLHLESLNEWR